MLNPNEDEDDDSEAFRDTGGETSVQDSNQQINVVRTTPTRKTKANDVVLLDEHGEPPCGSRRGSGDNIGSLDC